MKRFFYSLLAIMMLTAAPAFGAAQNMGFLLSQVRTSTTSLIGGKVYFYAAGTSTPKTAWLDSGKATPAANPYTLDSNGTAQIYGEGLYRIVIKDPSGVTKFDRDNLKFEDKVIFATVTDYTNLADAVSKIGSTPTTLTVGQSQTLTGNLTIPSTLEILPINGATITVTGYTLTYNASTSRWPLTRIFTGTGTVSGLKEAHAQWFGAAIDGTTDDTTAINAAAAAVKNTNATLYITGGSTAVTGQLDLRYVRKLKSSADIVTSYTGAPAVIIGDNSAQVRNTDLEISSVRNAGGTTPSDPFIRIVGLKNGRVKIGRSDYVQIYADSLVAADASTAYNQFEFNYVAKLEFATSVGGGVSWINENKFFGGRFSTITMSGTYLHNNNIFYGPTLESAAVTITSGIDNIFHDVRLEGTCTITFGTGTWGNKVIQSWDGTAGNEFDVISATVTDNGYGNYTGRLGAMFTDKIALFELSANNKNFSDGTNYTSDAGAFVVPGLNKVAASGSFKDVWTTDFIPVSNGQGYTFYSDSSVWRFYVYVYDANKQPITVDPSAIFMTGSTFNVAGYYSFGANISSSRLFLKDTSAVKYIKLKVQSGNGSSFPFTVAGVYMHRRLFGQEQAAILARPMSNPLVLASSPTKGFAKSGQIVSKTAGGVWVCIKSVETTLSGTAAGGATSVSVTSATGIANGDIVGILLDDGTTHWTTVSGLSGSTFTVGALPSQASSGARIVFNLWL